MLNKKMSKEIKKCIFFHDWSYGMDDIECYTGFDIITMTCKKCGNKKRKTTYYHG